MKSLKDISWDVSEETYRQDPALSYSTLARYEREGFNNLSKLFDKISTPSLTFGSVVDTIITGGKDEFDEKFLVADIPNIPDTIKQIVQKIFEEYRDFCDSLNDVNDDPIIFIANQFNYQTNWRPETRAKVIKEKGAEYYSLLFIADKRTIIDILTFNEAKLAVKVLRESEATKFYFEDNSSFEPNIERFYQLKFKACLEGIDYRCMLDALIVFHDTKEILPIDLKTSCKKPDREWDFPKHYVEWQYQLQNRLYVRILQDAISKDDTYKDYKILPYKDIIIFKGSNTPLVWDIPFTFAKGTLTFGKNNQIEMRDPYDIGKELRKYLDTSPKVPNGILINEPNNLEYWLCNL
ncbi:MAG: hypothetical protein ACI398_04135 [Clostridium sp.]